MTHDTHATEFLEGAQAFRDGLPSAKNPFEPEDPRWDAWDEGWEQERWRAAAVEAGETSAATFQQEFLLDFERLPEDDGHPE